MREMMREKQDKDREREGPLPVGGKEIALRERGEGDEERERSGFKKL